MKKQLLILGSGTAGTMVANRMAEELDLNEWAITIVDRETRHYYQPGFLFIPFRIYDPVDVVRPGRQFLPEKHVKLIVSDIKRIDPEEKQVYLAVDDTPLSYDTLVIATGTRLAPEGIEGMVSESWHKDIFDFYTVEGATLLRNYLDNWEGGRLVVNVAEMPIKCPVAPLEFIFLADWYFTEKGIRDQVELIFATPLSGAFTKPRATEVLGGIFENKNIKIIPDFNIGEVDSENKVIRSWDEIEIPYDLLVTIPTNMGAQVIIDSEMGDELGFVPTNKHTLQSKQWDDVWVIGDAANVPTSKAGSVAHFMLETVIENILRHHDGLEPYPSFDGHANCFIETGFGKGILIDFNYDTEPLPGRFPMAGVGPFPLLKESPLNHWGKMSFKWVYWNLLLKGKDLPTVPTQMQMAGKVVE